jgi:hypothetical protein
MKTKNAFDKSQFTGLLNQIGNMQIENEQAIYQNEDTGVYFIIDFSRKEEAPNNSYFSVIINYVRPTIFALEADLVIQKIIEKIPVEIFNPQIDGIKEGVYSSEAFIRGWNSGNKMSYSTINRKESNDLHFLPTKKINDGWNWNIEREMLQKNLGEIYFVPKIMYCEYDSKIYDVFVHTDSIPTIIPISTGVFIYRDKNGPGLISREKDMCFLRYDDFLKTFDGFIINEKGYKIINYELIDDKKYNKLIQSLKPIDKKVNNISVDHILNSDLY